jgi:galactokinase
MDSVTWRAPGRVNLIGEHTDYNDGFVLPFGIAQGCTATISTSRDATVRVTSAQEPEPVTVALADIRPGATTGWAAYVTGIVGALGERAGRQALPGLVIDVDSDVPPGAGLSSSAALICSIAAALNDLLGLGLDRQDLVAAARHAENDYVGAPTGGMDQLASLLCRADHALLCDMRSLHTEAVPFDPPASGLALLVIDTRARHRNADGEYGARRASCEEAARRLGVPALRDVTDLPAALAALDDDVLRRRVRHVVTENERVGDTAGLLRAGQLADIGPVLTASHISMRDDYEITVPEVDTAVDVALATGALGARMTGGGFGGCVIALVPSDRQSVVERAVAAAYRAAGYAAPQSFVVSASAGAHRETNKNKHARDATTSDKSA